MPLTWGALAFAKPTLLGKVHSLLGACNNSPLHREWGYEPVFLSVQTGLGVESLRLKLAGQVCLGIDSTQAECVAVVF